MFGVHLNQTLKLFIMKKILNKNFLFAVFLGLFFSFISIDMKAKVKNDAPGDCITCWSSGSGWFGSYVGCATCTDLDGSPTGGEGTCTVN